MNIFFMCLILVLFLSECCDVLEFCVRIDQVKSARGSRKKSDPVGSLSSIILT